MRSSIFTNKRAIWGPVYTRRFRELRCACTDEESRGAGGRGRMDASIMSVALSHRSLCCASSTYVHQPPDVQPLPNLCSNQLSVLVWLTAAHILQRNIYVYIYTHRLENTLESFPPRSRIFCTPRQPSRLFFRSSKRFRCFCFCCLFSLRFSRSCIFCHVPPIKARLIYDKRRDCISNYTCETNF